MIRLTDKTTIDLILRTLDEQIRKYRQPIIDHKRAQNSLSNISKLPPEILGYIFSLTSFSEGFEKRSLDFLLVCNYWYEVASHTPELWSFWGNNLQDWKRCHLRHPEAPLDLVLSWSERRKVSIDVGVRNALQHRASQDTIRLVHLRSTNPRLLRWILWMLTVDQNEIRYSSVESFILCNEGSWPVDVSNFFANTHFSKLQHLELTNWMIWSFDDLALQTNHLTTLALDLPDFPSTPTTSQLLLLLTSNPSLQNLVLTNFFPHKDHNDHLKVLLLQLKEIKLDGEGKAVIAFLNKLVFPNILEHLDIILRKCAIKDILEVLGPYLQDHFRCHCKSQSGLAIYASLLFNLYFRVDDRGGSPPHTLTLEDPVPFLEITVYDVIPHGEPYELLLSLVEHTPQDQIVHLEIDGTKSHYEPMIYKNPITMRNIYTLLPNLRVLCLRSMPLSYAFPKAGEEGKDIFLSQGLQHLFLEGMLTGDDYWTPLTTFLSVVACTSSIRQLDFLQIICGSHMSPEVEEDIKSLVQEFKLICPS